MRNPPFRGLGWSVIRRKNADFFLLFRKSAKNASGALKSTFFE
jgi:hypothetical protein